MSLKIFVSSTYRDLKGAREEIRESLEKFKPILEPIMMEKFKSSEIISQETSLKELTKCQIYLLIIGSRYGDIIEMCTVKDKFGCKANCNGGISYTHCEYRFAKSKGMPGMYFILKTEEAVEKGVDEFKKEVKEFGTITYIKLTEDEKLEIEEKVMKKYKNELIEISKLHKYSDLKKLIKKLEEDIKKCKRKKLKEKLIKEIKETLAENFVKWVCIEKKIRLPEFFGRAEDLKMLWDIFDTYNVLCIRGFGGIGKTCLAEVLLFFKDLGRLEGNTYLQRRRIYWI